MPLHFEAQEFADRRRRALEALTARQLDALLMFKQEKNGCSGLPGVVRHR
jgi:hypothetical protein